MSCLSEEAKKQPINKLILPGTHDSAAYTLNFASSIEPASLWFRIVNFVAELIPWIGKFIRDWTITQEHSIRGQLDSGIRQLDFRVAYSKDSDGFLLMHTFNCVPLEDVLKEISEFLDANKEEVLIINMKSDWIRKQWTILRKKNYFRLCKIK